MQVVESSATKISCVFCQGMIAKIPVLLWRELSATHTDVPWCYKPVKLKVSLPWSLPLFRHCERSWLWVTYWHYKANSEIQFRNPVWTGEPCRLLSVTTCSVQWPLQHYSCRKPFRSRDVLCQRLGIKPHLLGTAWTRWMLPHQLAGISVTTVGAQKNLQLARVCQFLVYRKVFEHLQIFLSSDCDFTAVLSLWQSCGVDFEVKAFSTENVEERVHKR